MYSFNRWSVENLLTFHGQCSRSNSKIFYSIRSLIHGFISLPVACCKEGPGWSQEWNSIERRDKRSRGDEKRKIEISIGNIGKYITAIKVILKLKTFYYIEKEKNILQQYSTNLWKEKTQFQAGRVLICGKQRVSFWQEVDFFLGLHHAGSNNSIK